MHFKILEIRFLEDKSGKNPANFFETGPEPEPDIEAGYPAGTGFSRISGRFLIGYLQRQLPPLSYIYLTWVLDTYTDSYLLCHLFT